MSQTSSQAPVGSSSSKSKPSASSIPSQFDVPLSAAEKEQLRWFPAEGWARAAAFAIIAWLVWFGVHHFAVKFIDIYAQLGAELPLASRLGIFFMSKGIFLFSLLVFGAAAAMAAIPGRRGWIVTVILFLLFTLFMFFLIFACVILPMRTLPGLVSRMSQPAGGS